MKLILLVSAIAAFTVPAFAQDTTPDAPPTAASQQQGAGGDLSGLPKPQVIEDFGLSDLRIRQVDRGSTLARVTGSLPDGARIEIDLNREGNIKEIEARGNDRFEESAIRHLIPQPVLDHAQWPAGSTLESIEFDRDGTIELEGWLEDGREFEAEFGIDGTLLDYDLD